MYSKKKKKEEKNEEKEMNYYCTQRATRQGSVGSLFEATLYLSLNAFYYVFRKKEKKREKKIFWIKLRVKKPKSIIKII